jgi:hypothetical protein
MSSESARGRVAIALGTTGSGYAEAFTNPMQRMEIEEQR